MVKKQIIVYVTISILILISILCMIFVYPINKIKIDKDLISSIVSDLYSTQGDEYINNRKEYYVKNSLITQSEVDNIFNNYNKANIKGVNISNIKYSNKNNNSYGEDVYRAEFSLKDNGVSSSYEIIFFVSTDNIIYKSVFGRVN